MAAALAAGRSQAATGEAALAAGVVLPLDIEKCVKKCIAEEHSSEPLPHTSLTSAFQCEQQHAATAVMQRTSLSGIISGLAYLHSMPRKRRGLA